MINRSFLMSSLLILGLMVNSCGNQDEGMWEGYELLPVQKKENGAWSFVNPEGKLLFEDEFKNPPTVAYNGYFSVYENDGYTIYKSGGDKPIVLADCEKLFNVGAFEEGLIPVTFPEKRISVLDENGKHKFELSPVNGAEVVKCFSSFNEGMLLFMTDENKWGYYDKEGNVAIKPVYDDANLFSNGLAVVGQKDDENKYQYKVIDKKGNTVFSIKDKYNFQTEHKVFMFGYLLVTEGDRFVLLDEKGEAKKLSTKINDVEFYTSDYIVYKNEDREVGVMDSDGEIIIRPKYASIQLINEKTFFANKDDKHVILNSKGDEIGALDYKYVFLAYQFGYFVSDNGSSYTQVDSQGKEKGSQDVKNIRTDISSQYMVQSDYFDYASIAQNVAGLVDGLTLKGDYKIGEKASTIFSGTNPSDFKYKYTTEVPLDRLKESGLKYTISAKGHFSESLVNYDYNPYLYSYNYVWQPASKLEGVKLELNIKGHNWGEKGFKALVAAFKNKGYKVEKEGWAGGQDDGSYNAAVLTNGESEIIIQSERDTDSSSADIIVTSTSILPVSDLIEGIENSDDIS